MAIKISKLKSWKKVYGESIGPKDLFFVVKPKGKRKTKSEKAVEEFLNLYVQKHASRLFRDAICTYNNELLFGTPVPPQDFYGKGVMDEIDEKYSPGGTI